MLFLGALECRPSVFFRLEYSKLFSFYIAQNGFYAAKDSWHEKERGRLSAEANKHPLGVGGWLFALHPRSEEARVKSTVE